MGKYSHLKGKVPVRETERAQEVREEMARLGSKPVAELFEIYNEIDEQKDRLDQQSKRLGYTISALDALIQKALDAQNVQAFRGAGHTWSTNPEVYPVTENPAAIIEYFQTHGLESELSLTNTELAGRLKKHVKAEAEAGDLSIETETVKNPATGEDESVTVVRSRIPGVRVFLTNKLSRTKAGKSK